MTDSRPLRHWWEGHYGQIIDAITRGQIVPFLGADINLCNRPETTEGKLEGWPGHTYPPSNLELAIRLDEKEFECAYRRNVRCPLCDYKFKDLPEGCPLKQGAITKMPLQQVSQYIYSANETGKSSLHGALRKLFKEKYTPNSVHRFFAELPKVMEDRGHSPPYQLLVTTCFDSTLEQAFRDARQEFDLVSFIGDPKKGYFEHQTPEGEKIKIDKPNEYSGLSLDKRPVILKLYGGYAEGSFVITEDHYIDYLAHQGTAEILPASILKKLRDDSSTIWFLGYSLCYWNLRVILRRIWPDQISSTDKNWWAIQANLEILDRQIWEEYSVQIPPEDSIKPLEKYISELDNRLQQLPRLRQLPKKEDTSPMSSSKPLRNQVFISYSHKDTDWLNRLQKILKPAIHAEKISVWDDTKIEPGVKWRAEIKAALATAKVAVLLVSSDFLASDFIAKEELPGLLEAAEKEGVPILWVYVHPCLYEYSPIDDYQAAYNIDRSLDKLPDNEQEEALVEIGKKIIRCVKGLR